MTEILTAPAKINLCLLLGPARADGRHELVTLFQSVGLSDTLTVSPSEHGRDEVLCEGVSGPNLVADALAGLRAAGWAAPPLRVQIDKRIPVAAGMGGGSADAAAILRLAPELAPIAGDRVLAVATGLGADVPGQLRPGVSLGTGAGEILQAVPAPAPHAVLVLPQDFGLATPEVYREADRLGLGRSAAGLRAAQTAIAAGQGEGWLGVNDLQPAALSLAPEIARALDAARAAGAAHALVCGSGPTVIGLFPGEDAASRAGRAADALRDRWPRAVAVLPV
ncbi:MAG TPA: hypothetical protein VFN55_00075 [Solirubrobacteraceae bacterium]|nr:hypothetical protein [Solirubrobacteraceae bacterium]